MTNREWLNSLTDEELALWLCDYIKPTLSQIRYRSIKSTAALADWMKEEYWNGEIYPL